MRGERGVSFKSIGTLCGHLCKNGRTDLDAVWFVGLDGPKKSCVGGPDPPWVGAILGERGHLCENG